MWGAWRSSGRREKEGRGGCVYEWSGVHCIGWRLGYIGLSWTGWEEEYEYGWSPIQAARPKSIMMALARHTHVDVLGHTELQKIW
jgi:hypothetical protein